MWSGEAVCHRGPTSHPSAGHGRGADPSSRAPLRRVQGETRGEVMRIWLPHAPMHAVSAIARRWQRTNSRAPRGETPPALQRRRDPRCAEKWLTPSLCVVYTISAAVVRLRALISRFVADRYAVANGKRQPDTCRASARHLGRRRLAAPAGVAVSREPATAADLERAVRARLAGCERRRHHRRRALVPGNPPVLARRQRTARKGGLVWGNAFSFSTLATSRCS
jgi:hypothetical protein